MPFNINALKLSPLQVGSDGPLVRAWQSFLIEKEFPVGAADGDFGRQTAQATGNYQRRNGLPGTGVVDNATYAKSLNDGFIFRVPNLTGNLLLTYLGFGEAEIKDVQSSLNAIAQLTPPLTVDGDFGRNSVRGLAEAYKKRDVRLRDELEDKLSNATKQKLGADVNVALDLFNTYAKRQRQRLSGDHWHPFFPTSRSIADLTSPFRERVLAFQKAMVDGGAQIIIAATYRPRERAYLMHYSSRLFNRTISPENIPAMAGVDVEWVHYTRAGSFQAAADMVEAYGTAGNPVALSSRHTQRLAIDWNITWQNNLSVRDANGRVVTIGEPRNGASNQALWRVGSSYGVIKLANDPPHWSVDGA